MTSIVVTQQSSPRQVCGVLQVLEFSTKPEMMLEMWTDRQQKIESFFGPGIKVDIAKTEQVTTAESLVTILEHEDTSVNYTAAAHNPRVSAHILACVRTVTAVC